jgi:hypothetical protein
LNGVHLDTFEQALNGEPFVGTLIPQSRHSSL